MWSEPFITQQPSKQLEVWVLSLFFPSYTFNELRLYKEWIILVFVF